MPSLCWWMMHSCAGESAIGHYTNHLRMEHQAIIQNGSMRSFMTAVVINDPDGGCLRILFDRMVVQVDHAWIQLVIL